MKTTTIVKDTLAIEASVCRAKHDIECLGRINVELFCEDSIGTIPYKALAKSIRQALEPLGFEWHEQTLVVREFPSIDEEDNEPLPFE